MPGPCITGPVSVERRVPDNGVIMVTRQRIRVGRAHAGKTVTVILEDTHLRVLHNGKELSLHPRTSSGPRQPLPRLRTAQFKMIMSRIVRVRPDVSVRVRPHVSVVTGGFPLVS